MIQTLPRRRNRVVYRTHWWMQLLLLPRHFNHQILALVLYTTSSSKMSPMKYAQLRRSSLEDLKTLKSLCKENVISRVSLLRKRITFKTHYNILDEKLYCPYIHLTTNINYVYTVLIRMNQIRTHKRNVIKIARKVSSNIMLH